jgi:putative redox protein
MSAETVRVDWISDQVFLMRDRNEFPIVMTQPQGVNGADLLPLSLIGCSAWDIMSILTKQRQQVLNFEVSATSERDTEPPWRFRKIHIRYRFCGSNIKEAYIKRAIELSETKYCSIYATLSPAVEISSEYEIVNTTSSSSLALYAREDNPLDEEALRPEEDNQHRQRRQE